MAAVVFDHVSKRFTLQHQRDRSFQEAAVSTMRRLRQLQPIRKREEFWALRDVSFQVEPGETLGIIGENGSGKSTSLKLISRILEPTEGSIEVNGRVSALLELGAGFHPDLTGRENIYLNASILGFSRREIRRKVEEIIGFSELERFIDTPVKHYSSGMYMRLGFAIAINVDPDILLTDEVLAVGDEGFQRKCLDKIADLQARGKTILFVSHSMEAIRNLCTRVVWLNKGQVQAIGDVERVVDTYLLFVHEKEARILEERHRQRWPTAATTPPPPSPDRQEPKQAASIEGEGGEGVCEPEPKSPLAEEDRWGSGVIRFLQARFLNGEGEECFLHKSGDPATIEMVYEACAIIADPVFGIAIYRQKDDLWVYGTNTDIDELSIERVEAWGVVRFHMPALHLTEGQYWLAVAVHARDGTPYDYWQHCWEFSVHSRIRDAGIYRPDHRWDLEIN
jgi:ABC-type polysaccharide/polyol phosphate transport system ATPase subunit